MGEMDELVTQSKSRGGRGSPPGRMDEKLPQAHRLGVCQIAHPQAEYMKWTDGKCFGMERLRPAQAAPIDLAMVVCTPMLHITCVCAGGDVGSIGRVACKPARQKDQPAF